MGTHDKAWQGMTHLIFSDTALLPMKIEQTLAAAAPAQEVAFESIEDYDDALDYCKSRKDIGLIIMSDRHEKYSPEDIFRNFKDVYESATGFPAFGVLLYEDNPSVEGYRTQAMEPKILSYVSQSELLDKSSSKSFLVDTWYKYVDKFEQLIVPTPLQLTYRELANERGFTLECQEFLDRTTRLLSSNLNISWIELFACRWNPYVQTFASHEPSILRANPLLQQLCAPNQNSQLNTTDIGAAASSSAPLISRLNTVINILKGAYEQGQLDKLFSDLQGITTRRSPALVRHLSKHQDSILDFSQETHNQHSDRAG